MPMPAGGSSADPRAHPEPHRSAGWLSSVFSATSRDRVHNALIDAPGLGNAYVRLRPQLRHAVVTPRTQLILDGFPRSANAYAEWAFRYANGEGVRLAVRLHSPRAVQIGARYGVPTIVLVREPRAAVASWLQYKRGLQAQEAFDRYAYYYNEVNELREHVVIAPFDQVVEDFGAVIEACNVRFGTTFTPYPGGAAAEAWVRQRIESAWSDDETGELAEHEVPRPSANRPDAAEVLEGVLDTPAVKASVLAAETVYRRILAGT
jgi:hypothetical protein